MKQKNTQKNSRKNKMSKYRMTKRKNQTNATNYKNWSRLNRVSNEFWFEVDRSQQKSILDLSSVTILRWSSAALRVDPGKRTSLHTFYVIEWRTKIFYAIFFMKIKKKKKKHLEPWNGFCTNIAFLRFGSCTTTVKTWRTIERGNVVRLRPLLHLSENQIQKNVGGHVRDIRVMLYLWMTSYHLL